MKKHIFIVVLVIFIGVILYLMINLLSNRNIPQNNNSVQDIKTIYILYFGGISGICIEYKINFESNMSYHYDKEEEFKRQKEDYEQYDKKKEEYEEHRRYIEENGLDYEEYDECFKGNFVFDNVPRDKSLPDEGYQKKSSFSDDEKEEFLNVIKKCRLLKWKLRYEDKDVCDGLGWSVIVTFKDGTEFETSGYHVHPSKYGDFKNAINELTVF